MKIQDFSHLHQPQITHPKLKYPTIIEAITATLLFVVPALLLFILAAS